MSKFTLTNEQARRFMLLKHGLMGEYKFTGKQGILDYVDQAGCIQFDPIDVCGKNAELVLQSRVKGFTKQMLYELLYEDRKLIDYFDKNLAIMSLSDWKYFSRYREAYRSSGRSHAEVNAVCEDIKEIIGEKGAVSSSDLDFKDTVKWYWSDTKLSRAALESLYFRGELVVHHKIGTRKYYDLAENCIPVEILKEPDPYPDEFEHMKWRVLRRIAAIGLLWNKPSDAWLNIWELKADDRSEIFKQLLEENKIIEIGVENIKERLYCVEGDRGLLEKVLQNPKIKERCELLAPLDNMLWDRKLIKLLFGFEYKWEIYTPEPQRKYGYYVLPVLYGDRFVGRIEAVNDRKAKCLIVKNIWFEAGVRQTKKLIKQINICLEKFASFNDCEEIKNLMQ
ncbi:winged helix-turn-helix domain-containing protein [Lutispora saccharofermentans]|uniref:Winged helix DNA-binding domain-containing protein n=1 Tax=Lutispora saccharofermentans TaxID=3024236 RepID=A0ABT1NDM3_9FIRM|nr:crosslink repair DNA glycosylase YcaQ family protein [Lutispora saccharofermentans]MCQ1529352.1 winged helix DNA-binding domain-containing protein [Lutispora saccharofermentans]